VKLRVPPPIQIQLELTVSLQTVLALMKILPALRLISDFPAAKL
jgi:hypothetical protein